MCQFASKYNIKFILLLLLTLFNIPELNALTMFISLLEIPHSVASMVFRGVNPHLVCLSRRTLHIHVVPCEEQQLKFLQCNKKRTVLSNVKRTIFVSKRYRERLRQQAVPLRTRKKNKNSEDKHEGRFFADAIRTEVKGGNGGDGKVSLASLYRKEFGGPDGGNKMPRLSKTWDYCS